MAEVPEPAKIRNAPSTQSSVLRGVLSVKGSFDSRIVENPPLILSLGPSKMIEENALLQRSYFFAQLCAGQEQ